MHDNISVSFTSFQQMYFAGISIKKKALGLMLLLDKLRIRHVSLAWGLIQVPINC